MGRAVYSQTYALPEPAIHAEPEASPTCERWTSWNHFDPDSEEFFQDAEYEAFLNPAQSAREQAAEISASAFARSPTGMSDLSDSASSEGSVGELEQQRESGVGANNSPMAVGSDDPAMLIANVYSVDRNSAWIALGDLDADEVARFWPTNVARDGRASESSAYLTLNDSPVQTTPAFIPSPSIRSPSPLRSPTLRRMVPITPITITRTRTRVEHRDADPEPAAERSPSPASPTMPATPPPTLYRLPAPRSVRPLAIATPSPPPSVTPRFYSWQQHSIPAVPVSPTAEREREREREGPLTNPLARMSFVRIDAGPTRVRIPNTVM
ncbi:hypothetical protein BDN70DRAFT_587517 [Pholiota conissans]|uniref:Uncharacterized protein n=1 Tax=Pholiota conissans TaxID=109636 RepID=A0A9P5ZDH6_9AGAR|nr:hypothetical protein BDN70DRAFT_587517 [Pholiota conissans]